MLRLGPGETMVRAHTACTEDPGAGPGLTTACGPLRGADVSGLREHPHLHAHTHTQKHTHILQNKINLFKPDA